MKLIIDIPEGTYEFVKMGIINQVLEYKVWNAIKNSTPLDDVKAEIKAEMNNLADTQDWGRYYGLGIALGILDNIGKAESEEDDGKKA